MEWMRLIGMCLLASSMVLVLRQMNPVIAGLLCAAFGVMVVLRILPWIMTLIGTIQDFFLAVNLDSQYYHILLKTMGVTMITQMTVQLCHDMDAPSIARRAEFCGRIAMLGIAMPVFLELTQLALDVLK